jgi:cytochrome o ubiquinol oxidase subunit 1
VVDLSYNFAVLPRVETIDAFWHMKRIGRPSVEPAYEAIEMPRNSPAGSSPHSLRRSWVFR